MKQKLALPKNQKKSDWRELTLRENMNAIRDELLELEQEWDKINRPFPTGTITGMILECADVANRAMMLADMLRMIEKKK